jgi:RND family efflux transporter MFP subunit
MGRSRGAIALATALICAAGCAEQPEPREILRPVRYDQAIATGGSRERIFSGTARAGQETHLSFRVSGRVERLDANVGGRVQAGTLIARLEQTDFRIAVRRAEADLAQSRARLTNSEANLERVRGLYENDSVSQNDLDSAIAQFQSTRAQVEASTQALESARRQLGYSSLRAPVDGAIASVAIEVNENVTQGQPVVLVTSGSRPEVEVGIPEILISYIKDGAPVSVAFDALPGELLDAVVTEVGVAATGAATTFPVKVRLIGENTAIRSGMAANVTFRFESQDRERIYLPSYAVGEDRGGRFVFLLEPAEEDGVGIVRRTAVEVGTLTRDGGLEVLSGVSEGQNVVTAGVRRLIDGQRVKLLPDGRSR